MTQKKQFRQKCLLNIIKHGEEKNYIYRNIAQIFKYRTKTKTLRGNITQINKSISFEKNT